MVVDNLKVLDRVAFALCAEVDLRLSFPSSLCVNGEVGGFVDLDAWRDTKAVQIWICVSSNHKKWFLRSVLVHGPGSFFSLVNVALSVLHRAPHSPELCYTTVMHRKVCTVILQACHEDMWTAKSITCLVHSRTFCSNFGSIIRWLHFYSEGAGWNLLFEH